MGTSASSRTEPTSFAIYPVIRNTKPSYARRSTIPLSARMDCAATLSTMLMNGSHSAANSATSRAHSLRALPRLMLRSSPKTAYPLRRTLPARLRRLRTISLQPTASALTSATPPAPSSISPLPLIFLLAGYVSKVWCESPRIQLLGFWSTSEICTRWSSRWN